MTSPSKTTEPTPAAKSRRDEQPAPTSNGIDSHRDDVATEARLDELARAREDLAQQVRQVAARDLITDGAGGDGRAGAGRMLTTARAELLQELLREQQEQARRQLAVATRSGEEAVAGVVRSVATVVRSVVPAALVRPEDLIEATFSLADQGLRLGRSFALTVAATARDLAPLA